MLSGGLTLAVLILPPVIITSAEAIRAVPRGSATGLRPGASRWQVVRQLVLPSAGHPDRHGPPSPAGRDGAAILAGRSSACLRAAAAWPTPGGPYAALPTIIFDWARKPQEEFRALTSAAILVLLAVTILANTAAIILRNRYDRRW